MKKALFLVLAVALAVGSCCNRNRLPSVKWKDWSRGPTGAQYQARDLPWIDVTVRTNPGQEVEDFGVRIGTEGSQQWIHGEGSTSPRTLSEPPFWLPAALDADGTGVLRDEFIRDLDEAVGEMEIEGLDEAARVQELARIQSLVRIQDRARAAELDRVETAGEVYFRVNGQRIGVKLFTSDEGWLERIHIDTPEGRSGDEVTIVGYYSGSVEPIALMYPMKKCIWCGDIEICSANATCR